jgi:ribonuclease MRP protein subunit RMP1
MACTARTCRITGITSLYEDIASEDMRAALQMIDNGEAEAELSDLLGGGDEGEDLGEVIERWE